MEYRYRISQDEMRYLYENARGRMNAHPEYADEQKKIIQKHSYFKTEKEALLAAIRLEKESLYDYQIWAEIEKKGDVFRIQNHWILTDDWKTKQAADYIGMALMYDETRLQTIVNDKVEIDDVIAYY